MVAQSAINPPNLVTLATTEQLRVKMPDFDVHDFILNELSFAINIIKLWFGRNIDFDKMKKWKKVYSDA